MCGGAAQWSHAGVQGCSCRGMGKGEGEDVGSGGTVGEQGETTTTMLSEGQEVVRLALVSMADREDGLPGRLAVQLVELLLVLRLCAV